MNNLTPKSAEHLEQKRKLLCWILQWITKDSCGVEPITFDLSELTVLMQALGFKLKKFEKSDTCCASDCLSVQFVCKKSGMRSILVKENNVCKCPQEQDVERGQLTPSYGPSSQETIKILNRALHVLNSAKSEANEQAMLPDINGNLTPSQRTFSLDTINMSVLKQKRLKRQVRVDSTYLVENLKSIQKSKIAMKNNNAAYKRLSDIKPTEGPTIEEISQPQSLQKKLVTPRCLLPTKKFNYSNEKNISTSLGNISSLINKTIVIRKTAPVARLQAENVISDHEVPIPNPSSNKVVKSKIPRYVRPAPKQVYQLSKGSKDKSTTPISSRFKHVMKAKTNIAIYKKTFNS